MVDLLVDDLAAGMVVHLELDMAALTDELRLAYLVALMALRKVATKAESKYLKLAVV